MLEAGVDLVEIQQILGHTSILTTSTTHLTGKTENNARQVVNSLINNVGFVWRGDK